MKKFLIPTSILGLVLSVGGVGSMLAQNAAPLDTQTNQPMPQDASQSGQQQDTKAFTGMIVNDGNKLVLKDMSSNTAYKLDDEKKVKDYVGKMVKITGTLDQVQQCHSGGEHRNRVVVATSILYNGLRCCKRGVSDAKLRARRFVVFC